MGLFFGHPVPRSARGERGCYQSGAWFHPHQCDETYRMGCEPGSTPQESRYPRWAVSLLKLDNGKWVSGWGGCWVAGPQYLPYSDRDSALQAIVLATIRQAWRQYRATWPQRYLIGIEAEELDVVTSWAVGLMDRPEPRRVKRAQRRTLLEAAKEG